MDNICFQSLLLGFPFMTLGLIAGSSSLKSASGPRIFVIPRFCFDSDVGRLHGFAVHAMVGGMRGRRLRCYRPLLLLRPL